jgi:hypothetical protein
MRNSALIRTLSQLKDGEYVSFGTAWGQSRIIVRTTKTSPGGVFEAHAEIGTAGVIDSATADVVVASIVSKCISDVRRDAEVANLDGQEAGDAGTTA